MYDKEMGKRRERVNKKKKETNNMQTDKLM